MKRRVSFLLMMVLALALAFALSSCGECEHAETEIKTVVTESGNCKIPDKIDEIVVCANPDCGVELSRTSKNGEIGEHVPGEPVYENFDVLDCTKGGTCEEVKYCTVARCGQEIEGTRKVVELKASASHNTQVTTSATKRQSFT